MSRALLATGLVVLLVAGAATWYLVFGPEGAAQPIRVGLLHSKTGPMAISERSMIDAELLALEEINARGGLLGRRLEPVVADGRSDWPTFAREAGRLIDQEKVSVLFGCWTSASRKMVRPVVERADHLLVYPMAYEGLEESPNIIYTGAAPNQQIIPAVKWSYDRLKARRFFLVGSDYVWPRTVNAIVGDQLRALDAELVGETYIHFGSSDVDGAIERIKASRPDVVLSTVVGDSNIAFFRRLREAGLRPDRTPVVTFGIAEDELRRLSSEDMTGNYAAWNYFQSLDRPENLEFVRRFKERYGSDRVTSDVIATAYNSVYLWAQAVRETGTEAPGPVRMAFRRQSLNAPEGIISIDPKTQHTWRPVYIGRVERDGQFAIVWDSRKPVRPVPYPISRSRSDWDGFLDKLYAGWGNRWSNPVDEGLGVDSATEPGSASPVPASEAPG